MESVEKIIELLHKKRAARKEEYALVEKQQIAEYDCLTNTLKTIRDERNNCKEHITKNLECLTTHKHSIDKLIHSSEKIPGLPVSQELHGQVSTFLTEGIDFINKFQNIDRNFNSNTRENIINYTNLIHDITSCIKTVETELYETKSLYDKVKTLQENIDVLQEYLSWNDENSEI